MTDPENNGLINNINNYFNNLSYSQEYSKDILISVILIIIVFGIFLFFLILNKLRTLRKNWPIHKCNPFYMPFAGIINPQTNQSAFKYATQNVTECMDEKNQELGLMVEKPINNSLKSLFSVFDFAKELVKEVKTFIIFIFDLIIQFFKLIFQKIYALINELNLVFISITNLFGHLLAIFGTFYHALILFIRSLELVLAAMVMGWLGGMVIPAIIVTIIAWGGFVGMIGVFFALKSFIRRFPWLGWIIAAYLFSIMIMFVFAIIATIFMLIVLVIYMIFAEFVSRALRKTPANAPKV